MKLKTTLSIAVASLGLMVAVLAPASAQFANFTETGTATPFDFTNSTGTFTLLTATIPVDFVFSTGNGYGPSGDTIAATMSLTAVEDGHAYADGSGPTFDVQPLTITGITFTADTPVNGQSELLNITGTGSIYGVKNGGSDTFGGDNTESQVVNYSSDFLIFGAGDDNYTYALTLGKISPTQNYTVGINGNYLKTFKASGSGNFFADEVSSTNVPEPSASAAFLLGGLGLLGLMAFGRKTRSGSMAS
jgi:hypothetical protein